MEVEFQKLDKLTKDFNLIQTIQGPAREDKGIESIIDLIFTNNIAIFNVIDMIKNNEILDHHRIQIDTNVKVSRRKRDLNGGTNN